MTGLGEGPGPSQEKNHGMEVLAKCWALVPFLRNPSGSSPRLPWLQEVVAAPRDPTHALAVLLSDGFVKNSVSWSSPHLLPDPGASGAH